MRHLKKMKNMGKLNKKQNKKTRHNRKSILFKNMHLGMNMTGYMKYQ